MKFLALSGSEISPDVLKQEYKGGHEIGIVHVGETCFFFKKGFKVYYLPYTEIRRCFRRVMLVPAKMCCGRGDFEVENIVICTDAGEVAQVQLPGAKAGKVLLDELMHKAPHAKFTKPIEPKPDPEE